MAWKRGDAGRAGLSRRTALRLAGGGVGVMAVAAGRGVWAQDATAVPDPVADPVATAAADGTPVVRGTPPVGGTPVGAGGTTTIYSGRNEDLIGPVLARCQALTGVKAEVRYGDSPEMAATILEEGDNGPASLFISQDAGLLGVLAREGRLAELPADLLERVDPRFRSPTGQWIGISGRARVAVYNTDLLTAADLPASVLDLTDPRWRGQVGWAPGNASFLAFITALRTLRGEDAARAWLEGMIANEPVAFDGNGAIVRAVGAGELSLGLVNHYYMYEIKEEEGEDFPIANHFFAGGDPGSLVNVAGLGILTGAPDAAPALAIADCLLGTEAQTAFAAETYEYPLIAGIEPAAGLPPLADIESPDLDLTDLADLEGTQALLEDIGLV